jgi:hypothetical protein
MLLYSLLDQCADAGDALDKFFIQMVALLQVIGAVVTQPDLT